MQLEITKAQAVFLVECIAQKPFNTTLGAALGGVKLSEELQDLVSKLEEIAKNEEPQTGSGSKTEAGEAVAAEVV